MLVEEREVEMFELVSKSRYREYVGFEMAREIIPSRRTAHPPYVDNLTVERLATLTPVIDNAGDRSADLVSKIERVR